jgi:hypothetical protein
MQGLCAILMGGKIRINIADIDIQNLASIASNDKPWFAFVFNTFFRKSSEYRNIIARLTLAS